MPSEKSLYFARITGRSFGLASLCLSLAGCGLAKQLETCRQGVPGLRLATYSGENLANLELSLVFLKGPSPISEGIGAFLGTQNIAATFFTQGSEVEKREEVLGKLVDQGHRIGTGGFSFASLKSVPDPVVELKAADFLITPYAFGNQYWLFGESGSLDNKSLEQLKRAGFAKYVGPIHSDTGENFVSDDQCWEQNLSVAVCTQGYIDEITRIGRGIIPFHDRDERTLSLVESLIPQLVTAGFSFRRLDQISDLRSALTAAGGTPDATKGAATCNDYE